jgi:hypothetical protein
VMDARPATMISSIGKRLTRPYIARPPLVSGVGSCQALWVSAHITALDRLEDALGSWVPPEHEVGLRA